MEKTKRDKHNTLDHADADSKILKLQKDLVQETIAKNKDQSFSTAVGSRRDVVVKFQIFVRNTVDNNIVRSDYEDEKFEHLSADPTDPYRYKLMEHVDGEIMVCDMPMRQEVYGKWVFGCFQAVTNYIARLGIISQTSLFKKG